MSFSILSDFSDEDMENQMDIGMHYSNVGSYADEEEIQSTAWTTDMVTRDLCNEAEEYSISNPNSTSWASALIFAAEAALKKAGYNEELSLRYVLKCLPQSQEIDLNEVTVSDIITFVSEKGLMDKSTEEQVEKDIVAEDELCSVTTSKFYFDVIRNDVPNMSGLMNFIAEGNPVIVLMALDLVRLKTVNDVTGNEIYTGATNEPTLYGVVKGYDETKWTVTFNVVPCENIEMNLPMVNNYTSANYAGIAGFAMSLKVKSVPEEIISYDVVKKIEEIPSYVSRLRFKHYDPSDVTSLTLIYNYLLDLTIAEDAFPIVYFFNITCPILRSFNIYKNAMSNPNTQRRLADLNGNFILDTPSLADMSVGMYSLYNFIALSVIQIDPSFTLRLSNYSMSNIERVEYMVEIPMDIVTQIQSTIEMNEGHEKPVQLVPINPIFTPTPTPTPTPQPWFPIYDPFILGDNCNYATSQTCRQETISERNVTNLYLAIRDAYPTKALAHTRVIVLSGVDNDTIELWRVSLSKQVMNIAPIDFYIMHDPIKGRTISAEIALSHLALTQYLLPRILFIGDGTLYREGFIQVLQFLDENKDKGWFKNLEEFTVIKNYIATYDYQQEAIQSGYAANLTTQIVGYLSSMCSDKTNFPNLRYIDLRMNGYNLQGYATFGEALRNATDPSTGVTIVANETLVKYPVFCVDDADYQAQTTIKTYYYDMNNDMDVKQCRFNWNWEVNGMFNNDINGPYPLDDTPNCPGYEQ